MTLVYNSLLGNTFEFRLRNNLKNLGLIQPVAICYTRKKYASPSFL